MQLIKTWFLGLISLLFNIQGGETDPTITVADPAAEGGEGEGGEGEGSQRIDEDPADDGSSAGDGNEGGKKREQFIPRDRFDQVNAQAQKFEKLKTLGIIEEDANGELLVNPEILKPKVKPTGEEASTDKVSLRFTKDEVDEASWPLVEKINKAYDHYDQMIGIFAYQVRKLNSENLILREYPEILQKDSPLMKKAQELLKNDPEFVHKYKGDPEKGYYAVRRAAEILAGKPSTKVKQKPKSKFISGRGDAGKTGTKMVPISSLSPADLDRLEQEEHNRIVNRKQ